LMFSVISRSTSPTEVIPTAAFTNNADPEPAAVTPDAITPFIKRRRVNFAFTAIS